MNVLAIDVGGSGSRWRTGGSPRGRGPGATIGAGGADVAQVAARLARNASEAVSVQPEVIVAGVTGLLGLVRDPAEVHAALRSIAPRATTVVCSDAVTALASVHGLVGGSVVAAGTGVIGFGGDFRGIWRRVDGWGHVLGDEGGGAWIGRKGLRAALRAHDGRSAASETLRSLAEQRFGDLSRLPSLIYTRDDRARLLAGFAPDVADAANDGDAVAASILAEAGLRLAETGLIAVGEDLPRRCALTGGVRLIDARILDVFKREMALHEVEVVRPAEDPLDGALLIAERLASDPVALHSQPPYLTKETI